MADTRTLLCILKNNVGTLNITFNCNIVILIKNYCIRTAANWCFLKILFILFMTRKVVKVFSSINYDKRLIHEAVEDITFDVVYLMVKDTKLKY